MFSLIKISGFAHPWPLVHDWRIQMRLRFSLDDVLICHYLDCCNFLSQVDMSVDPPMIHLGMFSMVFLPSFRGLNLNFSPFIAELEKVDYFMVPWIRTGIRDFCEENKVRLFWLECTCPMRLNCGISVNNARNFMSDIQLTHVWCTCSQHHHAYEILLNYCMK